MDCKRAEELIDATLDAEPGREPGALERNALESHLAGCDACRARRDDYVGLRALFAAARQQRAPASLIARVTVAAVDQQRELRVAYWSEAGRQARRWLGVAAAALIVAALFTAFTLATEPAAAPSGEGAYELAAGAPPQLTADALAEQAAADNLDADTMLAFTLVGLEGTR